MNAVDAAIVTKLAADATLTALGVTGVFRLRAPQGQALPYVIAGQQAGGDRYTLARRAWRDLVYQVRAVDGGESAVRANQINDRADALLTDQPLAVAGHTTLVVRRTTAVEFEEISAGVVYQHVGGLYRIEVAPS